MLFREYINAARRHKESCELLARGMRDESGKNINNVKNLYYLSGYIIECSIKFGILSLYGHPRNKDVQLFYENGLSFDSHLRHHRFERYDAHLQRFCIQAPLIDKNVFVKTEIRNLYKDWDSNLRYVCQIKYENNIYVEFFKVSCSIMEKIIERSY